MNIHPIANSCITLLVSIASVVLLSTPVWACSVPVFQYALAYWTADPYGVIVFHRGPLSSEEQAIVDRLQRASWDADSRANVVVETVDLAESPSIVMQKLWEAQQVGADHPLPLPWMVVRYPRFSGISEDAWSGPFTAADVEALLDSPIRKEIVRRLLDGEAAVWILLESGVQQQDEAAASLLGTQLKKMSENLKIWVPEVSMGLFNEADLTVTFSVVRLSRSDASERMFVQMLLNSEWDLKTFSKPIAFPIFGRGRALYALVGDGIRESNIEGACAFLVGWCSCVVKEQNPGVDLLISVNWDYMIDEALYEQAQLLLESSEATATGGGSSGNLKRNILIVALVQILSVFIVASAVLWRKRKKA
jgi:hypothetical protein